jgi:hypothetical protein
VFFHSSATNQVAGDTKGVDDILRDLTTGAVALVSAEWRKL